MPCDYLLIPGFSCAATSMQPLANHLRAHHYSIFDHLQDWSSYSPNTDLKTGEFLSIREVASRVYSCNSWSNKKIIVAHSWGCRIALELFRCHPKAIAGIVLIEGSLQIPDALLGQPDKARISTREKLSGPPSKQTFFKDFFQTFVRQTSIDGITPESIQHATYQMMNALPEHAAFQAFVELAAWEAEHLSGSITSMRLQKLPLLILQSTTLARNLSRTPITQSSTSNWIELLKKLYPDCELVKVENSGHFLQMEKPIETSKIISNWAQKFQVD